MFYLPNTLIIFPFLNLLICSVASHERPRSVRSGQWAENSYIKKTRWYRCPQKPSAEISNLAPSSVHGQKGKFGRFLE